MIKTYSMEDDKSPSQLQGRPARMQRHRGSCCVCCRSKPNATSKQEDAGKVQAILRSRESICGCREVFKASHY